MGFVNVVNAVVKGCNEKGCRSLYYNYDNGVLGIYVSGSQINSKIEMTPVNLKKGFDGGFTLKITGNNEGEVFEGKTNFSMLAATWGDYASTNVNCNTLVRDALDIYKHRHFKSAIKFGIHPKLIALMLKALNIYVKPAVPVERVNDSWLHVNGNVYMNQKNPERSKIPCEFFDRNKPGTSKIIVSGSIPSMNKVGERLVIRVVSDFGKNETLKGMFTISSLEEILTNSYKSDIPGEVVEAFLAMAKSGFFSSEPVVVNLPQEGFSAA